MVASEVIADCLSAVCMPPHASIEPSHCNGAAAMPSLSHILVSGVMFSTCAILALPATAQSATLAQPERALARDVFQQLIETNTSHSIGSTTVAAEAMRKRLIDAGFPQADVVVMGPDSRHGNLVARYRGASG